MRTYIQTAQGTIEKMEFNSTTGEFFGQYKLNTKIEVFTVVYISEVVKGLAWHPNGAMIAVTGPDGKPPKKEYTIISHKNNRYKIAIQDASWNGKSVRIRVGPK